MVKENEKKKILYDAASNGDLDTFQQQVQGDPFLLDEISFAGSRNLLHIATIWGQKNIVKEVLRIHPQLAWSSDSQKSSALHIAAAQGSLEITQMLLEKATEMLWWRDCQGMNPVHVASMNGHVEILEKLLEHDIFPAMEKVDRGQTVLHLCVKYSKYSALRYLVRKLGGDFVRTEDDDGETSLHLAARNNQVEMIQFLVEQNEIPKMSRNFMKNTAWDIAKSIPQNTRSYLYMRGLLRDGQYLPNQEIEKLKRISKGMMVAAGLVAAMAFQVTISPPGGVWQEGSLTHNPGEAVMASIHPRKYRKLMGYNALAFMSSLLTIGFVASTMTFEKALFFYCATMTMYMSVACIGASYIVSLTANTPKKESHTVSHDVLKDVAFIVVVMAFVLGMSCVRNTRLYSIFKRRLRLRYGYNFRMWWRMIIDDVVESNCQHHGDHVPT